MGDDMYSGHNANKPLEPHLFSKPKNKDEMNGLSESNNISIDNIKILEWDFSKPISNSFE
jgi:hypothetical protein